MKVFAADSADKMRQIKRQAGKLYSKMEADLPEEEFSSLSEGELLPSNKCRAKFQSDFSTFHRSDRSQMIQITV